MYLPVLVIHFNFSSLSSLSSLVPVVDIADSSEVVGSLKVTIEALDALKSIMEDPDHDHSMSTSLIQA